MESGGNVEITPQELKIFYERYVKDLALILEPEAISFMPIIRFEQFLNSYTMQFAAKCTAKALSFAHDFRIAQHASHLVFLSRGWLRISILTLPKTRNSSFGITTIE